MKSEKQEFVNQKISLEYLQKILTNKIKKVSDEIELYSLITESKKILNGVHVAAALGVLIEFQKEEAKEIREIFELLEEWVKQNFSKIHIKEKSVICNALTKIVLRDNQWIEREIIHELSTQGLNSNNKYIPQTISMLAHALSKVSSNVPGFDSAIKCLVDYAIHSGLSKYKPKGIAMMANALSKISPNVDGFDSVVMSLVNCAIQSGMSKYKPKGIAMLANALSKVSPHFDGFEIAAMSLVGHAIQDGLSKYKSQDIAMLANVLRKLGASVEYADALKSLAGRFVQIINKSKNQNEADESLSAQGIANVAHALAIHDVHDFDQYFVEKLSDIEMSKVSLETLRQMYWYLLNVQCSGVNNKVVEEMLPSLSRLSIGDNPIKSAAQNEVARILRTILPEPQYLIEEYPIIGSNVDFAITNQKLIIEFQGPHHYTESNQSTAQTLLKLKLLRKEGWSVAEIPYYTWHHLSYPQKEEFLKEILHNNNKLEEHLGQLMLEPVAPAVRSSEHMTNVRTYLPLGLNANAKPFVPGKFYVNTQPRASLGLNPNATPFVPAKVKPKTSEGRREAGQRPYSISG